MADGTYVLIFQQQKAITEVSLTQPDQSMAADRDGWIKVVASRDGGDTIAAATTVAPTTMSYDPVRGAGVDQGIAADIGHGPFANRLYVVWRAAKLGRSRIWFAYSSDGGRTWSPPVTVDDSPPRADSRTGPNDFMPAVAVNDRGVVGVLWYDRRDHADDLGWYTRFTASLDGGDTFLPSVRVSSAPMSFSGRVRAISEGSPSVYISSSISNHTVGLAAGADGVFHPVWVDNRSGLPQLWTAAVHVDGSVLRNASTELAELQDVSSNVRVYQTTAYWNQSTGHYDCDLMVKNTSKTMLRGPITLRVLRFESELGPVTGMTIDGRAVPVGSAIEIARSGLPADTWSKGVHVAARIVVQFGTHDQDAVERFQNVFSIVAKVLAPHADHPDAASQQ
jgi:hypothetical protein